MVLLPVLLIDESINFNFPLSRKENLCPSGIPRGDPGERRTSLRSGKGSSGAAPKVFLD
jgi:hypothetical protein